MHKKVYTFTNINVYVWTGPECRKFVKLIVNRDFLARVFPRLAPVARIYSEF